MGALMSLCTAGELACCCTCSALNLCCIKVPFLNKSISTRAMYSIMLFLTTLTSFLFTSDWLIEKTKEMPFCKFGDSFDKFCQNAVSFLSIYRIMFAQVVFFLLFSFLMINVKSSKDLRTGIQNGFWGIKYLLLIGFIVGSFFISDSQKFSNALFYSGLAGGFLFIIIQMILIIDFSYNFADYWNSKRAISESKFYIYGTLFFVLLNYIISFTGILLLYFYYTGPNCTEHKYFLAINIIICLIASYLSIDSKVQNVNLSSSLIQSSVITLYMTFLTWSAFNNSNLNECKPQLFQHSTNKFDIQIFLSLFLWFACLLFSSIRTSSSNNVTKLTMSDHLLIKNTNTDANGFGSVVLDDKEEAITYNWSFFHFIHSLATLYVLMTLTNWSKPDQMSGSLIQNEAAMWIKIISSWICAGIYIWSLIAPLILTNRDFSY